MSLFWNSLCLTLLCSFSVVVGDETKTFIVRVQNDIRPLIFSDVEEWYRSILQTLTSSPTTEGSAAHKDLLHVYRTVFHGFSTKLTKQEAQQLKKRPEILGVIPDRIRQIQTTRSPLFLGLVTSTSTPNDLLSKSDSGSSVVIGVLDTGIWPEHQSFRDEGLDPVPSQWKGECDQGEKFSKSLCNKKLVGARYFTAGYSASVGPTNETGGIRSARDADGHGTHTASTAAGMHVDDASLLGYAQGVAVGMAPKARIASYKICWERGCIESDILAGFDKAVEDGVNIISLSVGGPPLPYNDDSIAIGSFGATEQGVIVSASAGNSGPADTSLANLAPWITNIGAGTIDRTFPADLILGDGRVLTGVSLYKGKSLPKHKFFPLIYGGNASTDPSNHIVAEMCMPDSLNPKLVRGKIVVCDRDGNSRTEKGLVVKKAGGIGVVVANRPGQGEGLIADAHFIPGLLITESASYIVRNYTNSSKNPKAKIIFHGTQLGVKPAPVVASFSSRGPNPLSQFVLKPDMFAPGENILAAWPPNISPTGNPTDTRRTHFNIVSGTSMSCPHASGLMALLKGAHPDWSPAMIRSALMTTADTNDRDGKSMLDEAKNNKAVTWAMGAGHVDPEKANDPGLVYDITVDDYIDFLCVTDYDESKIKIISKKTVSCKGKTNKPWNLNYPAISIPFNDSANSEVLVRRTATHVSDGPSSYKAIIVNPEGAHVTVNPQTLNFKDKGEKQSYVVRILAVKMNIEPASRKTGFGEITWTDGKHKVASPIVMVT